MFLSEIAFEQISGNYWYGQYGDFKVIMMKDCGYVNATKLCTDGGKEFNKWARLEHSKLLTHALVSRYQVLDNTPSNSDSTNLTLWDSNRHIWRLQSKALKKVVTSKQPAEDKVISATHT